MYVFLLFSFFLYFPFTSRDLLSVYSRIPLQLERIMFMFWYLLPMSLGSPASHATLRHDFSKSHKSTDREEREKRKSGKKVRELFPDVSHVRTLTSETHFCEIVNDSFKHHIFQKITQILFWQSPSLLGHVRLNKTLSLQFDC